MPGNFGGIDGSGLSVVGVGSAQKPWHSNNAKRDGSTRQAAVSHNGSTASFERGSVTFEKSPSRSNSRAVRSRIHTNNLGGLRPSTLAEPIGEKLYRGQVPPSITTATFRSGAERVPVNTSTGSQQLAAVEALKHILKKADVNNVGIVTPQELMQAVQCVAHRLDKHLVDGIKQELLAGAPDEGIIYTDLLTSLEKHFLGQDPILDNSQETDVSSKGGPLWALQKLWNNDPDMCWKSLERAIVKFRKFDAQTLRHVMVQFGIVATGNQVVEIFRQLHLDQAKTVDEMARAIRYGRPVSVPSTPHSDARMSHEHGVLSTADADVSTSNTDVSTGEHVVSGLPSVPSEAQHDDVAATTDARPHSPRHRLAVAVAPGAGAKVQALTQAIRDGLNANIHAVATDVEKLQQHGMLSRFVFRALINRYCRRVSDVEYNAICAAWGLQREFDFAIVYEKYIKEPEQTQTQNTDVAVVHGDSETFSGTPTATLDSRCGTHVLGVTGGTTYAQDSWLKFAATVTQRMIDNSAQLLAKCRKADGAATGVLGYKTFKSVFCKWFGGFVLKRNFDKLVQPYTFALTTTHPQYARADKGIAYESFHGAFENRDTQYSIEWLHGGIGLRPRSHVGEDGSQQNSPSEAGGGVGIRARSNLGDGHSHGATLPWTHVVGPAANGACTEPPQGHDRDEPVWSNAASDGQHEDSDPHDTSEGLEQDADRGNEVAPNTLDIATVLDSDYGSGGETVTSGSHTHVRGPNTAAGAAGGADSDSADVPRDAPSVLHAKERSYKPLVLPSDAQSTLGLSVGLKPKASTSVPLAAAGPPRSSEGLPKDVVSVQERMRRSVQRNRDQVARATETKHMLDTLRISAGLPTVRDVPAAIESADVVSILEENVRVHYDVMLAKLRQKDPLSTGYVTPVELRRVLEQELDLKMSNTAYCKVLHHINSHRDSGVKYAEFLLRYGGALPSGRHSNGTARSTQQKLTTSTASPNKNMRAVLSPSRPHPPPQLQQKLDRAVRTHLERLRAAFRTRDWRGTGLLSPAEFLLVLRQFDVQLSSDEALTVTKKWSSIPGETAPIKYTNFLRAYRAPPRKGAEDGSRLLQRTTKAAMQSDTTHMTPRASAAFDKIRKQVLPKWTAIRRDCLRQDGSTPPQSRKRSGYVSADKFKEILAKHGITISKDTFYHIHAHTDFELKKGVKYDTFFKSVIGR
eukprot:m.227217 g.227217  ORF g.227217 m.227217 type:complete len:1198 (+) comp19227_c0_seq1:191-3784(+)